MNRKLLTGLAKILTNVFSILFGLVLLVGVIMKENPTQVTGILGGETQKVVEDPSDAEKLKENPLAFEYFPSAFQEVKEVKENGKKMVEQIVAEGTTLLKNDNAALPLSKGSKVSLFSISSVDLVYAGTGSSGTNTSASINMKTAMERAGFSINDALWNWYNSNKNTYGRGSAGGSIGTTFNVKDANWNQISTTAKTDKAYGDAAIFVLARSGGEGADLTVKGGATSDKTNGNYLELSPTEIDVLTNLKAQKDAGVFKKIIVLMNSANQVQCDFVDDAKYGVDAMLWCGDLGSTGAYAVADILAGNVNPSGRLSDTFWKKHYYNPVYANWGAYNYTGTVSSGNSNTYVAYQEGIYNGYRYTETRYEDVVLGRGNAGDFNYEEVVSYPFGYGLSYTEFEYSDFKVKKNASAYDVSVTVKNTGSVAGKQTVEIYLQKPYTDYDIDNGVEKAAVELVGFAKTKELAAGASETVTVSVDGKYFASYDAYGAKTYIVDAGDYYFATGTDAHDALNNILESKSGVNKGQMTDRGNASLAVKVSVANFDDKTYSTTSYAKERGLRDEITTITNQFDNADLKIYEGKGENSITYITRNDWEGTTKLGLSATHADLGNQVKITATEKMRQDVADPTNSIQKDDTEYPTYGAPAKWMLADLRAYSDGDDDVTNDKPIEFNNPLWDELLDQLTYEETAALLSNGFRLTAAISSIAKPLTIDHNGATGPTLAYVATPGANTYTAGANRGLAVRTEKDEAAKKENPALYPCNGLCASTYNVELMKEYGRAWGEDCLWAGYNGLYGPGLNMHRGAYGGRSFEYYSEDGVLTGYIAAALTEGMAEKGAYVYLKHCVLNDQETKREGICTWANEQSIREVYLRGFQIAIEDGGAQCVMTGFNRLGVKWTGHQGFCKTVLHDEFGMTGIAVSDWWQGYMTLPAAVLNGNDLPDGDKASLKAFDNYSPEKGGYGELAWAMRDAAHRILYTVVQSNAMNGLTANTKIVQLTPWWVAMIENVQIGVGVLFGASVIFLGVMLCLNKFKPAQKA